MPWRPMGSGRHATAPPAASGAQVDGWGVLAKPNIYAGKFVEFLDNLEGPMKVMDLIAKGAKRSLG